MDTEFDFGPSEPKRPRNGRQSRDILDAIERDTTCEHKQKSLRSALLHLGEMRSFQDIAFSTIFKNQAFGIANLISADPSGSASLVLER